MGIMINNNRIAYHRIFDVADTDRKKPVDDASIFGDASISKTAYA